jgi:MFS family permease
MHQMIEDLNITEPSKVPYYSGLIESIFALSTFLSVLPWGRLSDRIGRKPVMILGLCGASVSVIAFGFSQTFWMMVVFRALGGLLNGNVAVIKSMLGEVRPCPDNTGITH